jgi:L-amino acid N-acyltransferase YncA
VPIIRDAHSEDVPSILRIYNWAILNSTATFDLEEQTLEQRLQWFSKYGGPYPLIVAEEEGEIVGYGCLSRFRDKPAYGKTVESSVYIDKDHWGKGIGKALVNELIQRAEALGYHTIIAGITSGNEASEKLHQGFGFRYVGCFREVGHKFGEWRDVTFYQLMLKRKLPPTSF